MRCRCKAATSGAAAEGFNATWWGSLSSVNPAMPVDHLPSPRTLSSAFNVRQIAPKYAALKAPLCILRRGFPYPQAIRTPIASGCLETRLSYL